MTRAGGTASLRRDSPWERGRAMGSRRRRAGAYPGDCRIAGVPLVPRRLAGPDLGLASLLAVVAVGGCCSCPPASKFIPQDDHYTALRGFLYAIETGQWEEAYSRLTAESREGLSPTDMWLAFWARLKIPGTDVPVADVIERHDPFIRAYAQLPDRSDPSTVFYPLIYDPEEGPGEEDNVYFMRLFLVKNVETDAWEIDLLRSAAQP